MCVMNEMEKAKDKSSEIRAPVKMEGRRRAVFCLPCGSIDRIMAKKAGRMSLDIVLIFF